MRWDKKRKETRLQGLKDCLAISDNPEAEVLHQEAKRSEQEIEDLTYFWTLMSGVKYP